MAIFIDGFEQFAQTDRPEQYIRLAGYSLTGSASIAAGRKAGGSSMSLYRSVLSRAYSFAGNLLSIGMAVKYDKRGPVLAVASRTGTNLITLRVDPTTGLVNVNDQPGYVAPLLARWYYFELEMNKSASTVSVYVNGKLDATYPLPAEVTGDLRIKFNPYDAVAEDYGTRSVDDIYISDSARLGPLQITTRFPTSTVTAEWSVTGADGHHVAVSPPVDVLDKYIFSGVADAQDTFKSNKALPDTNPIRYLQLLTLYRKATSDPLSLQVNIDGQVVTLSNLPRDWTYSYTPMNADGYTPANLTDAEFGVKLKV